MQCCCLLVTDVDERLTARSRGSFRRSLYRLAYPVSGHRVLPEGQLTGACSLHINTLGAEIGSQNATLVVLLVGISSLKIPKGLRLS